jgi:hypothetical protein
MFNGWGLLLFEMLSGRPLYAGVNEPEHLFAAILNGQLPPDAFEAMPGDCSLLIRRCLRRTPAERPSMSEVLQEIKRLTPMADVASAPVHRFRHKPVWIAAASLLVILIVGLALTPSGKIVAVLTIAGGVLWMTASVAFGFWLRGWLGRHSAAKTRAFDLAAGAKSRTDLTATIALRRAIKTRLLPPWQ